MKTKKRVKIAASIVLAAAVMAVPAMAFAAGPSGSGMQGQMSGTMPGQMGSMDQQSGTMPSQMGGMGQMGQMGGTVSYASSPSTITTSSLTSNSAESLTADTANATTIEMSDENSSVKIDASGTYIITGSCSDGNIVVKKGTTGVVLILKDLDLTSTTGATLSVNKGAEAKIIIEGTVKLTDAEDIADEESDDFDGAAIKAKAGSSTVLTGSGTLIINGSCKNGIKVSDLDEDDAADGYSEASFIIEGSLSISITAANDGINSGTDLTIKSGSITVSAADDGIHADYILTIGQDGSSGPTIKITRSTEALEGATVNIYSGTISLTASDDGINAANSDLTGYTYSINIMGGTTTVSAGTDGLDSNGNINITGGLTTIAKAASGGGDAGLDYLGSCYVADGCLVNPYGVSMDSGMGGMMGDMGQMSGTMPGQSSTDTADAESGATPQFGTQDGTAPQFGTQDGTAPQFGTMPGQTDGTTGTAPQFGTQDGTAPQFGTMPGQTDGTTGTAPQFGTQDGQMPQMNGNAPQMNGELPEMNGELPETNGEAPQMNGELPEMNGELPETNGEAPQMGGELPGGAVTETISAEQDAQELNWFQNLIQVIRNWFANTFNRQSNIEI